MLNALKPIGQLPGVADCPWQWLVLSLLLLYITFLSSSDIYSPDIYWTSAMMMVSEVAAWDSVLLSFKGYIASFSCGVKTWSFWQGCGIIIYSGSAVTFSWQQYYSTQIFSFLQCWIMPVNVNLPNLSVWRYIYYISDKWRVRWEI